MDEAPRVIVIPYSPRAYFRRLHESEARWIFVVAHRRAGKTVALVNHLIRACIRNTRTTPPPRYAYIGPSFAQTKELAWGYLKYYTAAIPGMQYSESELWALFPNGGKITLYGGAAAYERMRGLYFDGTVLDEYPLLNPDAWPSVVRPCLADYRGFAIMSGTSNGDDHFHEKKQEALTNLVANGGNWDYFDIKVTETDALHPDEVDEMRSSMPPAKFEREMMNSFDAPIDGAYYADLINNAQEEGRITLVPHDPRAPVMTWWDLGMRDLNSIWFVQRIGRGLGVIDHEAQTGKGLDWYWQELHKGHRSKYNYGPAVMPHDIMVRELGTGRSRFEIATELGFDVRVAPRMNDKDYIEAVRSVIPVCHFDAAKTASGISSLKHYRQGPSGKPLHDWSSHDADSFRHGCVMLDQLAGWSGNVIPLKGPLRRRIKGVY